MDNLYQGGDADGRQSTRAHLEAGEVLFRPRYRKLTENEIDLHDRIKTQAAVLAALFYEVEPINVRHSANRERGANVQLAIRNLEDAVYRAVKALTGPVAGEDPVKAMPAKVDSVDEVAAKARAAAAIEKILPGAVDQAAEQQTQEQGRPIEPTQDAPRSVEDIPAAPPAAAETVAQDATQAAPQGADADASSDAAESDGAAGRPSESEDDGRRGDPADATVTSGPGGLQQDAGDNPPGGAC